MDCFYWHWTLSSHNYYNSTCSPVWLNSHSPISRSSLNLIVCQKCTLCILGRIITSYTVLQYNTLASLTVVLESIATAPTFRGFLIQARLVTDDSTVVGQFEAPPVGAQYRYGSCANTEVEKNKILFTLRLPYSCKMSMLCIYI